MQAEGIRKGDRYDVRDQFGKVVDGWTAVGDAILEGSVVTVDVRYHDGSERALAWHRGEQVPLSFGVGS